jgi:hypothetical protein
MKPGRAVLIVLLLLPLAIPVAASGPVGIFAVIERVAFEPNEEAAERIKLWGAFSFVDGGIQGGSLSTPVRGYLYFRLPTATEAPKQTAQTVKNEWSDFKAVAGSAQAIAFGNWGYIGRFNTTGPNQVFVTVQVSERSFRGLPLSVYADAQTNPEATPYLTNTGIVKISDSGRHAAIVKELRDRVKR